MKSLFASIALAGLIFFGVDRCWSEDDGWIPLFNGNDLTGWTIRGKAYFSVEDGALVGMQGANGEPGDIFTEKEYDDFELKATFKVVWPANSGIWFRYQPGGLFYQVDILEKSRYGCTVGSIYAKGGFITKFADESIVKMDDWNSIYLLAQGPLVIVKVNDVQTADITDDRSSHGLIGIQVHPGKQFEGMKIMIKDILLRPLKK